MTFYYLYFNFNMLYFNIIDEYRQKQLKFTENNLLPS